MKVLLVDDEASGRHLMRRFLEKLGATVMEAESGEQALQIPDGDLPGLVLLDWMLPQMSGIEVCRALRARPDGSRHYVIMITSRGEKADVLAGLRAGANDYLEKPVLFPDLSARIQVARQFLDLRDLVNQQRVQILAASRMAFLGHMANGMAHEIKNPLAVIGASIETLIENEEAGRDSKSFRQKAYRRVTENVHRIAGIINGLREFAGDGSLEPLGEVSVGKLVEGAVSLIEAAARENRIEVRTSVLNPSVKIRGQEVQLCRALVAILDNAVQAVQEGGSRWIEVRASEHEGHVAISVTDGGPGIPTDLRIRVMQPFFTTRPAGKGQGLGLSIAKGIIESNNGQIALIEDHPHTRFEIVFPLSST